MQVLDKILDASSIRFMQVGIRSVSMDDIASAVGISKKTIYQHIENKNDLVAKAMERQLALDKELLIQLSNESTDALDEMMKVARHAVMMFRSVKPTLLHDLQKYYRDTWHTVNEFHANFLRSAIRDNIVRGQEEGIYREDIDSDIVSTLYMKKSLSLVDETTFSLMKYNREKLMKEHVMYHLHGILSDLGRKQLMKIKIFE